MMAHSGSMMWIPTEFPKGKDALSDRTCLSECYFAGKGTALVLPDADANSKASGTGGSTSSSRFGTASVAAQGSSNIQKHLQSMFYLLRPEETLKMAVKLESVHALRTRYLVVVSRMGSRGEECCLLGIDCNEKTTVGLVLRVMANTQITLDGDGGFSVSVCERHHIFKPVSVQAMWSALQTLHKVSAKAREQNYFQGGLTHSWVEYYENRIESDRSCLNEWHAMDNLESKRPPSPDSIRTKPSETEETEKVIRATLKEIMMSVDLDEVTSKAIRTKVEEELDMDLTAYKSFIDQEILVILGQMDAPTEIFDHVYLGSEWNASNYEELQKNGVGHILNVTREIDNFFPGTFDYLNIRVYDDEQTDLLKYWDDTYKYITKAKDKGSKVLVHCKMGISRSASVVIAYAMKACNWDFDTALKHVKGKRTCIKPNTSFLVQLETYQGILDAMKNKEKLQRSKSETNLKSPGSNGKNEKVLANSEPTPIIQAFSKSHNIETTMSGHDLQHLGVRPKSWSPDNLATREMANVTKSSPIFISLEDISQKSSSKESMKGLQNSLELKTPLATHVLMPCDNGESYSVSPNQIVHLPGHDTTSTWSSDKKKLVLNLATQFEMADQRKTIEVSESSCNVVHSEKYDKRVEDLKKDTWDPGEKKRSTFSHCDNLNDVCDFEINSVSESQTVWTSSTTVKTESSVLPSCNSTVKVPDLFRTQTVALRKDSDPFSNQLDKFFDREEKKQYRMSTIPVISSAYAPELSIDEKFRRDSPSRQSSWSSYDSAVALGFQNENCELSRHSSWGSGDTRNLPSRNSSWGSYDMRSRGPVHYMNEKGEKLLHNSEISNNTSCGLFPYEKEDIPFHPGTVKRSKQKIEGGSTKNPHTSDHLINSCVSLTKTPSSETLFDFIPEAVNTVVIESVSNRENIMSSAISDKINIPCEDRQSSSFSRLSISAPEQSSMELITQEGTLSRSASNVSSVSKLSKENSNSVISTAQCSSVKQHRTFLENLHNLQDSQYMSRKAEDMLDSSSGLGKVRNLKKEFEAKSSTNMDQIEIIEKSCKHKVSSLPSSPISIHVVKEKQEESKSVSDDGNFKNLIGLFENKEGAQVNRRHKYNTTGRPFTPNRNTRYSCIEMTVEKKNRILQTPLISNLNRNGSPVDKNDDKRPPIVPVVRNSTPGLMVAATVITAAKKKQQQYGKSHPLARLNIKPRHNNPVYNTM
ncbi:protein phosphatase Slingshot isoform X3 [Leptinotarsa decemlineata]|uniref:protein phosphatase Slingshot isoform X3 n=2 Tax=Leptinotarsa decemlineata TaxID=7539 RepID=UPI003D3072C9